MFEVLPGTAVDIFWVYIIVLSSCVLTYSIVRLFISALKGAHKWK